MNKKLKNEYLYRDIWTNRCNDNYFSNLNTDFHLVIPADELTEGSWSFHQGLHPQLISKEKHEQKRQ